MQALPIVEHLDVVEHGRFRFLASTEAAMMNVFDLREAKTLSIGALSRQFPRRLMDWTMPCRANTAR